MRPGETVTILTTGGGYGEPSEREPASVKRAVELGYVSADQAKKTYPSAFGRGS